MDNRMNWVIRVCCSGSDGVDIHRVYGNKEDVIDYMNDLMKVERQEKFDDIDEGFGGTDVVDVSEKHNTALGVLYGCNCFYDSHTDYSAYPEEEPLILKSKKREERERSF